MASGRGSPASPRRIAAHVAILAVIGIPLVTFGLLAVLTPEEHYGDVVFDLWPAGVVCLAVVGLHAVASTALVARGQSPLRVHVAIGFTLDAMVVVIALATLPRWQSASPVFRRNRATELGYVALAEKQRRLDEDCARGFQRLRWWLEPGACQGGAGTLPDPMLHLELVASSPGEYAMTFAVNTSSGRFEHWGTPAKTAASHAGELIQIRACGTRHGTLGAEPPSMLTLTCPNRGAVRFESPTRPGAAPATPYQLLPLPGVSDGGT